MSRPVGYRKSIWEYKVQYPVVISALRAGMSLRHIAASTGHSINTVRKIKALGL